MPLYELRENADNHIRISERSTSSVAFGFIETVDRILDALKTESARVGRPVCAAFEGWYGVPWKEIATALSTRAREGSFPLEMININPSYLPEKQLTAYKQKFITDDPAFGFANLEGEIDEILDSQRIAELSTILREKIERGNDSGAVVVYGSGSWPVPLRGNYDIRYYFDKTRQPLLWEMWDGKLAVFGSDAPRKDYSWKEYYYCDFYLLENRKRVFLEEMDFWVEAIDTENMKIVPRSCYDEIVKTMVRSPIKEVKIFQPGPWGAYRYKDLWEVPGLECNAWNELAGPELSILVDFGGRQPLNMPVTNLMQYGELLVGPHLNEALPGMFPLDIWLDDGYFPDAQPAERTSMPVHNHPSTEYVKRNFNEPLGRYETYYICEAYEGANTWMGFEEGVDLEKWEDLCRISEKTGEPITNWKDYIVNWDSNVGDLYLIPPGTTHGHGGNQMVLEMDTVPSVAGTEYSFFMYDYCRPSWDDTTKTMTGKPVKLHLDHGFSADQYRREKWVEENLRAKPKVVRWTKDYWMDRYASYGPMPFEIERLHFYEFARYDTEGRYMHIPTLTIGGKVRIQSKADPQLHCDIDLYQSCIIPACFGAYEVVNLEQGFCTVTLIRWKKG